MLNLGSVFASLMQNIPILMQNEIVVESHWCKRGYLKYKYFQSSNQY